MGVMCLLHFPLDMKVFNIIYGFLPSVFDLYKGEKNFIYL